MIKRPIFALCLIVTFICSEASCMRHSVHIKLSGPVELGPQLIELRGESPLKADKDLQWVQLELEDPFKDDIYQEGRGPDKGKGILLPNGDITNPEIEVVDERGTVYKLVHQGSRSGAPVYGAVDALSLPKDRRYTVVRLRSSIPIKCKAIYWFSESGKDWK
jgi:hypothetical protein